jgi:2',3'-cyclic-nucleotide 2'-phosphodiesterase (5'-nucleotidase family)
MSGIPAQRTLRLLAADPNPNGAEESQLYIFSGDVTAGPIQKVEMADGIEWPQHPDLLNLQDYFLCIYHFNDLHGHLMRFTPGGNDPVFSRVAGQIRKTRQRFLSNPYKAVLTFATGDDCTGSIFDELICDKPGELHTHPSYHLYSAAGVDAAVLGNHDFDLGIPVLKQAIQKDAQFPVLAANLRECRELSEVCAPAAILVINGVRIGLIGLLTRAENRLQPSQGCIVNPIPVAQNLVPVIRPKVDVLIILSHLGYSFEKKVVPMLDSGDVELARSLPYGSVHLIVGGHSHQAINPLGLNVENIVNGIPIVQAGARGRYLGRADITIRKNKAAVTDAHLISIDSLLVDQVFDQEEIQPFVDQAWALLSSKLGPVEDNPELSTDTVRNNFAIGELTLANFVTDAIVERLQNSGELVDIAVIDSSCLLGGLSNSDTLTLGDWFEIMPHADTMRSHRITGYQLEELLQDNAYRIDRPGEPHIERGFLHFNSQVRYTIALGNERKNAQISEITVNGIPLRVQLDRTFTIVRTSFIRELAIRWEDVEASRLQLPLMDLHALPYDETGYFLRKEIVAYIKEKGGVTRASGAKRDGRLQVKPG